MDPVDLIADLASGTPEQQAMAVDGVLIVSLPFAVRGIVALIERRPPNRSKDDGKLRGRMLGVWWALYRNRKRAVKAIPLALAILVTIVRAIAGAWMGLDPVVEGARGFGVALSAVGLRELGRSPGRVISTSADEAGDAGPR